MPHPAHPVIPDCDPRNETGNRDAASFSERNGDTASFSAQSILAASLFPSPFLLPPRGAGDNSRGARRQGRIGEIGLPGANRGAWSWLRSARTRASLDELPLAPQDVSLGLRTGQDDVLGREPWRRRNGEEQREDDEHGAAHRSTPRPGWMRLETQDTITEMEES